jgi:hypothetical protein
MFLGSTARPVRRAENLTAICEPMSGQYRILNISQPYGPPRLVTRTVYFVYKKNNMSRMGFEPMIPVLERLKTFRILCFIC